MAERDLLATQAKSFSKRAGELRRAHDGNEAGLIQLYETLAMDLQRISAMPRLTSAPVRLPEETRLLAQTTLQEPASMSYATLSTDPFHNETELLKQIALFQSKISTLGNGQSAHKRAMRSIYTMIVAQCRTALEDLQMSSAPATGTEG